MGQIQPFVYYTFDGGGNEHWQPWSATSSGYAEPQCVSACSSCLLTLPAIPPVVVNTSPQAVGDYALFNSANAQLRNSNINFGNKGISFETLIRFDDAFGVQRRANLFTLSRSTSQTQPGTFLNFYFNFDLTVTDGGAEIVFFTDPNGTPTSDANTFTIELTGLDRRSIQYYLDNQWHHVAFSYNTETGLKKIWIDGVSPAEFSSFATPGNFTAPTCTLFVNSTTSYDKMVGGIDEVAYYNDVITDEEVAQHFNDFKGINNNAPRHYIYGLTKAYENKIALTTDPDPNEFPFGHTLGGGDQSAYYVTHSALEQLLSFPLPRYKPNHLLHKNMNLVRSKWVGTYSSSDLNVQLQTSLDMQIRLASKWNYYFNLSESLPNEINDVNTPGTHPYKWMEWVTNLSNTLASTFEYALFTNRAQLPGGTLLRYQGFGNSTNQQSFYSVKYDYATNQYFQPYKYLSRSGAASTTKFWLPSSGINNYTSDGVSGKLILDTVLNKLHSSSTFHISYIVDNNEAAPVYDANSYDQTNNIPTAFKDNYEMHQACLNCTQQQWREYLGNRKIDVDNVAYRDIILNDARLANTNFLNYGVDGGPDDRYYWPKLRQTQRFDSTGSNGIFKYAYSTMDFYPITPSRWRIQVTNLTVDDRSQIPRGWRWLARSRKEELATGDKLYSPFVGAGWYFDEERNFRPGQWLGLMKCVGLTGVDFYHAYYDEITANPKGYIWQAAIPSYAQAILSRIDHMILFGNVLEGNINSSPGVASQGKAYAFNAGSPLDLITIRQDASELNGAPILKYAITGSIQKLVNMVGDAPLEENVTIDLNAGVGPVDSLRFNIRRQGSTYILDRRRGNANDVVFYQLDKWHQWEHPERWSRDFDLEAEVFDNVTNSLESSIHTEDVNHLPITNGDYRNFTSYVFGNANTYEYHFEPVAAAHYYLYIKARLKTGSNVNPSININLTDVNDTANVIRHTLGCISGTEWMWLMMDTIDVPVEYDLNAVPYLLSVHSLNDNILIDRIYIGLSPNMPGNGVAIAEAACPGPIAITASITPVTCYGANTGEIKVQANGAGPNYEYSINHGVWQAGSYTITLSNLLSGNYYIRARSSNDTTLLSQLLLVSVSQPLTPFMVDLQTANNCNNQKAGKITAVVTGGNMNTYNYQWNNGAITGMIEELPNGIYTVTVTDAKGCTAMQQAEIIAKQFSASTSLSSVSLLNCGSAKITITIDSLSNAAPPFLYSVDGGISFRAPVMEKSYSFTNQPPGNYFALVKDHNGCIATMAGNPLNISGTVVATISSSITPTFKLSCFGNKTSLTVQPTSGYKFLWNTGKTTSTITSISSGTYQVTVTQTSSLCTGKALVTITEPDPVQVQLNISNVTCKNNNDGTAFATITGGTTPFLIHWSNGSGQNSISGLTAGNYSVSVTDSNSCLAAKYFSITSPTNQLSANLTVVQDINCSNLTNGILSVEFANGVTPYIYKWSNNSTDLTIDSLLPGTYSVTVTDAIGCVVTNQKTLSEPSFNYYPDVDADNYGDDLLMVTAGCQIPTGYITIGGDCNDSNALVNPLITEICNGIDDNCDGDTDVYNMAFNMKCFFEGYYIGNGLMAAVLDPINHPMWCDSIDVDLYSFPISSSPAYHVEGIVDINGNVSFNMTNLHCGEYYIAIKHRSSIETWSKEPVNFNESAISFDFTEQ